MVLTHHSLESADLSKAGQQDVTLLSVMAGMAACKAGQKELGLQRNAYLRNKYGDEYACADELGFETSFMGLRADRNHIF